MGPPDIRWGGGHVSPVSLLIVTLLCHRMVITDPLTLSEITHLQGNQIIVSPRIIVGPKKSVFTTIHTRNHKDLPSRTNQTLATTHLNLHPLHANRLTILSLQSLRPPHHSQNKMPRRFRSRDHKVRADSAEQGSHSPQHVRSGQY